MELEGKRITVAGLGLHGGALGNIRWLHQQGARLTVTDLKTESELAPTLAKLKDLPDITWVLGKHRPEDFTNTAMVVRNPAMRADSEFLEKARQARVPIEMDSSLFFEFSPTKNIIGITGSKGKSTTTHVIAALLRLKNARVTVVGSEGTSPLEQLGNLQPQDTVVFELSSWRLEALAERHVSPHMAVVTSLYRDHLNTYPSFAAYVAAKKAIVRYQTSRDLALLNYDDPRLRLWSAGIKGKLAWYSLSNSIPGDGIYVTHGMITMRTARDSVPLFPLRKLAFQSEHARRNMLPAIYLAFRDGIRLDSIALQVGKMRELAHRLEVIRTLNSITYINDSAATIPEASIAALVSLEGRHINLILGGSDKKLRFDALAVAIREARIRSLTFLPGNTSERMAEVIAAAFRQPPPLHMASSMTDAVKRATAEAHPDDVVLLSPAATSFGHFLHEFDRGDQFREAVKQLS
jgi:UDP-N-acetylmuramoylalanine--D-glutamate ligase